MFPLKKALLLLLCALSPLLSHAQVGITGRYVGTLNSDWTVTDFSEGAAYELPGAGFALGIDYWFRLRNLRIEFTPELNYQSQSVELPGQGALRTELFSLLGNINVYVLDILNDCNCPTFSKQSGWVQKGFFVQLSPGLSLPLFSNTSPLVADDRDWGDLAVSLGVGLGIDLGLSDLVTITPIAGLRYFPNIVWSNPFPETLPAESRTYGLSQAETALMQWNAGLRIGWRFGE